jgi:hypothetical protein
MPNTSSNIFQIEKLKCSFYGPLKELSNGILSASIKVHLLFEIVKKVMFDK